MLDNVVVPVRLSDNLTHLSIWRIFQLKGDIYTIGVSLIEELQNNKWLPEDATDCYIILTIRNHSERHSIEMTSKIAKLFGDLSESFI